MAAPGSPQAAVLPAQSEPPHRHRSRNGAETRRSAKWDPIIVSAIRAGSAPLRESGSFVYKFTPRAQNGERRVQMVRVFRSSSTAAKRMAPREKVPAIPNAAPGLPASS